MKHVFHNSGGIKKTVFRDAHNPSQLYFEVDTDEREKQVVDLNSRIREAGLLQKGDRNPMADGDELTAAFQFPTVADYHLARAKYPDLFAELELGGDHSVRAGEKLSVLLPQYVTMIRRPDRLGK